MCDVTKCKVNRVILMSNTGSVRFGTVRMLSAAAAAAGWNFRPFLFGTCWTSSLYKVELKPHTVLVSKVQTRFDSLKVVLCADPPVARRVSTWWRLSTHTHTHRTAGSPTGSMSILLEAVLFHSRTRRTWFLWTELDFIRGLKAPQSLMLLHTDFVSSSL